LYTLEVGKTTGIHNMKTHPKGYRVSKRVARNPFPAEEVAKALAAGNSRAALLAIEKAIRNSERHRPYGEHDADPHH
jgi:hypothetical protein